MMILRRLLIRLLMKEFELKEKQMPDGESHSALVELGDNEKIRKLINITIGNTIRKLLYIKGMEEHSFYTGQIVALRSLLNKADEAKKKREDKKLDKTP